MTYELLDKDDGRSTTELRVVPALELHAETLGTSQAPVPEALDEDAEGGQGFDIVGEDGQIVMRNNRLTIDDASRQALSMAEIEELKKAGTGSGKEIIAKIMASHNAIDEKTTFSLAKYTLRKSRKYLKRFTALPLDVGILTEYILEKEAYKIMELREDLLGLICSWANIHCGESSRVLTAEDGISQIGGGRWLVVDDTGGLLTAGLAEKMGILYPEAENDDDDEQEEKEQATEDAGALDGADVNGNQEPNSQANAAAHEATNEDTDMPDIDITTSTNPETTTAPPDSPLRPKKPLRVHIPQMSASTNTLTVLHPNNQPNLSYLKYFGYDYGAPVSSHPLYKHLKSLSWLSLLHPDDDPTYEEPEFLNEEALAAMKSSKRGTYYRKRRRWERVKTVVDETRRGGFDGLVVATSMDVSTILKELVPLVRGSGRVVVYNPNVEPLVELCDFYSKERRAAYVAREFGPPAHQANGKRHRSNGERFDDDDDSSEESSNDEDDFPVNPTLLLAPSLQTARARQWQVLPGRTHPMMTSRGGAEGFIFTGTRVLPIEGRVEARGQHGKKKRKTGTGGTVSVK